MPLRRTAPHSTRRAAGVDGARRMARAARNAERGTALALLRRRALGPDAQARVLEALAAETHPAVRQALLDALLARGDGFATECLVNALRSDDAALRNAARDSLPRLGEVSLPALLSLLDDPDTDMRVRAVSALAACDAPERWQGALLEHLARENDVNVCAAILDALSESISAALLPGIHAARARFAAEPCLDFAFELVSRRLASGESTA